MNRLKSLLSFEGTAKRAELLRTVVVCAFLVWLAALVDERLVKPYLCSQDPLKIGCIPGEVSSGFAIEDNIALLITMAAVSIVLLAVMVRRLHDHGKSGWWLLAAFTGIGLLPLVYWFLARAPKPVDSGKA